MSADSSSIRNTEVDAESGAVVDRARWRYIPQGTKIEVESIRGNRRSGKFQGLRDDGVFLLWENGKARISCLLQDQLRAVRAFGAVEIRGTEDTLAPPVVATGETSTATPVSEALPGASLTLEDLKSLAAGSRVELMSVRGNPRAGIFRGLTPSGDIQIVPDGSEFSAVYPKARLAGIRLLANGPEQVQLQAEILGVLRREFQKASLAFASHADEMRGAIVVNAATGRIIEVLTQNSTEGDTLTWDEDGLLRAEFAEFTIRVNLNTGAIEALTSADAHPTPIAAATVHQCLADFVAEVIRTRRPRSTA